MLFFSLHLNILHWSLYQHSLCLSIYYTNGNYRRTKLVVITSIMCDIITQSSCTPYVLQWTIQTHLVSYLALIALLQESPTVTNLSPHQRESGRFRCAMWKRIQHFQFSVVRIRKYERRLSQWCDSPRNTPHIWCLLWEIHFQTMCWYAE